MRLIAALVAALITAAGFTLRLPQVSAPPLSVATLTATATNTGTPTATETQPVGSAPTATSTATDTPTPTATDTVEPDTDTPTATPTEIDTPTLTPTPTQTTQASGPCLCDSDRYNCSSFATHTEAQACYNYCISQGAGDIHKLDQDNDGDACESLPGNFIVIR